MTINTRTRAGSQGQDDFREKVGYPPNAQYYGPGGFMSTPGLENPVLSTYIAPHGIDEYLPISPARVVNPLYPIFTGVTEEAGSEPATVCDDGPTALLKGATLSNVFGRIIRSTPTMDKGELVETVRGQNTQLSLLANRGAPGGRISSTGFEVPADDILRYATKGAMFAAGALIQRKLVRLMWQGNPANNNPATAGYKEFAGLDLQIRTGIVDAESGVAVPSLDSYVKNANYALISEYNIVAHLQDMEFRLRRRAEDHFGSAEFVLVMRPEVWEQLTNIWPLQYNTQMGNNVLAGMSNVQLTLNADSVVSARDEMRRNQSIIINGNTYRVVLDHGIDEEVDADSASINAGEYASTIYFLPLTVAGGFAVTRIEYLDFREGIAQERAVGLDTGLVWTDDGRYIWSAEEKHTCFWFRARTEPRVILHTPHLAGKIQRVKVRPLSHYIDPYPDSAYHVDGGVSVRPRETLYMPWSG